MSTIYHGLLETMDPQQGVKGRYWKLTLEEEGIKRQYNLFHEETARGLKPGTWYDYEKIQKDKYVNLLASSIRVSSQQGEQVTVSDSGDSFIALSFRQHLVLKCIDVAGHSLAKELEEDIREDVPLLNRKGVSRWVAYMAKDLYEELIKQGVEGWSKK